MPRIITTGLKHQFLETSLHAKKTGIWAAIPHQCVVGPIFHMTRVTGKVYSDIITQFISLLT